MTVKKTNNQNFKAAAASAIVAWNKDYPDNPIQVGQNWNGLTEQLHGTFLFEYLMPKVGRTDMFHAKLTDRFARFTKFLKQEGQFDEQYTMTDIVPQQWKQDADVMANFAVNYPKMRTKFFNEGQVFQHRYSISPKDRLKFSSIGDQLRQQQAIYDNVLSSFEMFNEDNKKALLIDYALRSMKDTNKVSSQQELVHMMLKKYLNFQSKSHKHNEADMAAGNPLTRKTTVSNAEDLLIITTDDIKLYILESVIANTFQIAGLDITKQISSFEDLGGSFVIDKPVTIEEPETWAAFDAMGYIKDRDKMYFPAGSRFTFDVSQLKEFAVEGTTREIVPASDLFFAMYDINAFRFEMNRENGILIQSDDVNSWSRVINITISMMTNNNISPFASKCMAYNKDEDVANNIYVLYNKANAEQKAKFDAGESTKASLTIQEFMLSL